eukprot:jgi/Bigna1/77397/fgenesh1_pg.47_\
MPSVNDPLLDPQMRKEGSCCCRNPADNPTGAIIAAIIATIGSFMFGFNLGFTSPALPSMEWGSDAAFSDCSSWNMEAAGGGYLCKESLQGSFFASLINIGAMLGAFSGGPISDYLGRKMGVMLSSIPLILGWAWIAIEQNYYGLLKRKEEKKKDVGENSDLLFIFCAVTMSLKAGRMLTGFGMGMVTISVNVYIAEISPKELRGALGSLFQLNLTIGILFVYLLGEVLTTSKSVDTYMNAPNPMGFHGGSHQECDWRLLSWVGCGISTMMFLGMLFMPESPKYLLSNGRSVEAVAVLKFLRGSEYDSVSEVTSFNQSKQHEDLKCVREGGRVKDELTCGEKWCVPSSLQPMGIMIVLHLTQQFSGINAVIFFCQEIFLDAGVENPVVASLIVAVVQCFLVIMILLAGRIYAVAGRRVMLTSSLSGMTISCLSMAMAFHLKQVGSRQDWLAVLSLLLYISSFSLGCGAIVWIIQGELLPNRIRGSGGSITSGFNWTCSLLVTGSFQFMLNTFEGVGTFLFYAGVCAFGAIFVLTTVPETMGMELEAIEKYFKVRDKKE